MDFHQNSINYETTLVTHNIQCYTYQPIHYTQVHQELFQIHPTNKILELKSFITTKINIKQSISFCNYF